MAPSARSGARRRYRSHPPFYRILFPHLLTTKQDVPPSPPSLTHNLPRVDVEMYNILALLTRDFVFGWYHAISLDQDFVNEIVRVVSHMVKQLEGRCQRVRLLLELMERILQHL